ncbi:MAG: PCRF domain-containing protein, partial [Alphaproteobacteria bacterium]
MSLKENLDRVVKRHEDLGAALASEVKPSSREYARMSKEYADLTEVVEAIRTLQKAEREFADLTAILEDEKAEAEMRALAEEEIEPLKQKITEQERRLRILLLPKDEADTKNAILEVRAGTGGEEAALFAADLFRMYQRYAERHGWKIELLGITETGIGGYKEAGALISGRDVFARL